MNAVGEKIDERVLFEQWFDSAQFMGAKKSALLRRGDGYSGLKIDFAWKGWLARHSDSPAPQPQEQPC